MKRHLITASALALVAGAAQAQVELKYMMWGDPPEIAVWEQLVSDFQETHPDISISVEVADWDSYWNKLRVTTAGGDAPDIFAMDAPVYPDWQSRGTLLNLQPYIDADPGALDGVYEGPLSSYALEDGYYGMPRDFQTIVLYYNTAMFDEAGLDYPDDSWTLDDLRAAAEALTIDKDGDGTIDQWGIGTEAWDMEPFWGPVVYGYGGDIISEDGSTTLLTEGAAPEAFAYVQGLFDDGLIMSEEDLDSYGWDGLYAGVAAMAFSGHWVVPAYSELDFDWAVAPFPAGPEGRATLVNSAGIVASSSTEYPDEAWEFISYVISEEGQSTLAQLGFAIPVNEAAATGPAYLEQPVEADHQLFVDALDYAHTKPSFLGYEEWSEIVGEPLSMVWRGEMSLDDAMSEIGDYADDALN
ncbi:ABC transporter substrate-binding protein [Pelagovum pacificum]|uniref:sn-glycerol-3-phosphate-binding periplasmic protein UgpB n=1 Tax=Pelagovum pacificum TaxID=2588711 RepID=A0A5C5GE07_9RHOB|nr:sugar ABC transporter substrate-binding protein [Pelagovum pacificum]QQA44461.1 sugar ABC transporter substrate-binding protein [Pelagovum pacificum]TNY32424.1 sugar ABC transporter substrate-binding protein [Pelagovum pacificum]